jgi:DNA processing protein
MGKQIFTLPHHIGESSGTNRLLKEGLATPIYDIEEFASGYGVVPQDSTIQKDEFFYFCQTTPTLDEAISKFGDRIYEAELEGLIRIEHGLVNLA